MCGENCQRIEENLVKFPERKRSIGCKRLAVRRGAVLSSSRPSLQQIAVNKVKFAITQENRRYSVVLPISWPRYICKVDLLYACSPDTRCDILYLKKNARLSNGAIVPRAGHWIHQSDSAIYWQAFANRRTCLVHDTCFSLKYSLNTYSFI